MPPALPDLMTALGYGKYAIFLYLLVRIEHLNARVSEVRGKVTVIRDVLKDES